ncbi:hypothetical protein K8R20_02915 [bacterium]|nr:hypothetical protein [bacterium]
MKINRFNKDLFWSVLVIAFFFLSTNAYAQEYTGLDLSGSYGSTVEAVNVGQGAEGDEYNSARSQAVSANTAVVNAIIYLAPEISSDYQAMLDSDTISPDMKRGIYGMTSDGVYALYESQPLVNVYAHLAEEWVPGYQADSSVYASITTSGFDSGYDELVNTGISGLWSQVRNITYVFFILIMIVVGFMIMFRSKLGGQTLVTLGNTLPNIILALIGVTFSFAIAGVIIDIGGLMMVLLVDIFSSSEYSDPITLESLGSIFRAFTPEGLFEEMTQFADFGGKGGLLGLVGGTAAIGVVVGFIAAPLTGVVVGLVGLILVLAILAVVTVGVFKVFLTLIKAYIGILIAVITGPFQIAMSAIPGQSASFINWMKSIMRNVLVYPITFAILNIPGVLYAVSDGGLSLPGPDKLTLPQTTAQIDQSQDLLGGLLIFVLQIFVIFIASKADVYAKVLLPPTTSKDAGDAAQAAKQALGGIPLLGKLIK